MVINTDRAECTNCHIPLDTTSQTVVDETAEGLVVLCMGICPTCHEWHQWYAHYSYKGHMGLEKTNRFHAKG
jgi:hypothetical protein